MTRAWSHPEPKLTMPCSICGEVKDRDGFHPSMWNKNCRRGHCKVCLSNRRAQEYHHGGVKEKMETSRQRRMALINAIKAERGCKNCNEHDPVCLDFHHRNPDEKVRGIGTLVCSPTTTERILEEVGKCDVICANCHRKLHRDERRKNEPKAQRVEALTLRLA